MRAILVGLAVMGCASSTVTPPDPRCGGPIPELATVTDGVLVARCGELEVTARPLAGGILQLPSRSTPRWTRR